MAVATTRRLFARYATGFVSALAAALTALLSAFYLADAIFASATNTLAFGVLALTIFVLLCCIFWRLLPLPRFLVSLALIACSVFLLPHHNCGPSEPGVEQC